MYYSDEVIEEVRSKNDIVDVISTYVRLQKKGSSYFGLCPFHNEKSPSFSVSRPKQMYYCFGCGAGGNVFTFLMEYENYSFVEALKYLADRAGVDLPEQEYSKEAKERADTKAILLEINKLAAQYYYVQLKNEQGAHALAYLKNRELSDDTIRAFGLGYSNKYSNDLYQYLRSKGYQSEMLLKAGLVSMDERQGVYDKFWNRVMFPIMDANSRVIGFGGRVMGDGKPKYLNSPETIIFDKSRNLYGLNRARSTKKPYFLLCEGYMDVISLHQAGFTNAVASLGTALTAGHASLIKRYVQEVYLTYDSDEAGTKAALRAVPILKDVGITARIIRMEPYKDPDEFIKNLGAEAFEERIGKARNGFMFSLEVLEKDYDLHTPEGKTDFMREAARRLTEFDEEIERKNYIEAVAAAYHVGNEDLQKLVARMAIQAGQASPARRPKPVKHQPKGKEDGIVKSQKILLTWLIEDVSIFRQIEPYITPSDFSGDLYRTVAELLYEQYEAGDVNPAKIMNHFTDEEEHREVASLFHTKIRELTTVKEQEKALKETVLRVKNHSIEVATRNLEPTDMKGLQRLMEVKSKMQDIQKLHISVN
ncbi:DNA primase [Lachnospiraceae bacterium WCA-9-b2]|uniref:DNA primase n=1 Tax=Sporofaciens musculi TaxID=2681861 RepID=A0A7X3SIP0_9FIRM|nr:DNA primase [Sporofaciens musculi]MCI9423890.1 DNA primase [Dorea sp.]MXP75534.1 DNA primase [Sporofaciens musculi]